MPRCGTRPYPRLPDAGLLAAPQNYIVGGPSNPRCRQACVIGNRATVASVMRHRPIEQSIGCQSAALESFKRSLLICAVDDILGSQCLPDLVEVHVPITPHRAYVV